MSQTLSITQVASILEVSERTVYRLMEQDKLHPWKSGKSWKFDQADLDAYIEEQRRESAAKLKEKREKAKESRANQSKNVA